MPGSFMLVLLYIYIYLFIYLFIYLYLYGQLRVSLFEFYFLIIPQ
jgi:hypothetical protein